MKNTLIISISILLNINNFAQHGVTSPWQTTAVQLPKLNPTYAAYTTVGHTMVVDKLGKIYVFYREFDTSNQSTERLYINTSTDGINWTPAIFPPAQYFKPGYYNVAIDTLSNIHVVWVKSIMGELRYSKFDYVSQQWIIDTVTSQTVNYEVRGTTVSIDRNLRVHVAWIDGQDTSVNAEIIYRRSPDNGLSWDSQQNISNSPGFPSAWQQGDFSGTFSDTLAYAWRENVNPSGNDNWDITIAYTTDGGVNWQTRIDSTASGPGQQRDPVLTVLKDNSAMIAYEKWLPGGGKEIYAGRTNNIVSTNPIYLQISDTVYSELLIDGYDYNNNLYYAFWKWRYTTETPGHMDIAGRFFDAASLSWSNTTSNNGVEWCTDIGSSQLGFKKCAIGPDGKVHLLYGMPPTGMASLYYTYRTSPLTGFSYTDFAENVFTIFPNPTKGELNIQCSICGDENTELKIYDILGREMKVEFSRYEKGFIVQRGCLKQGIYLVKLQTESGVKCAKLQIID